METITKIGTRPNGAWLATAFDLHIHYGYETMLLLFDTFTSKYQARVARVAKSELAGQGSSVVWQKVLWNKARPLSEMPKLKEECGSVSIGCFVKAFHDIQLYISLINQTSIVVIEVPDGQYTEKVQSHIESIAQFFQNTLLSIVNC